VSLLFGLTVRLGGDLAERAAHEERLRLSREIHDGLTQQLALLRIRLARAAALDRTAEQRAYDLAGAARLVEAAVLEARQATIALCAGTVSREQLARAVRVFADEFAWNHHVAVRVTTEGEASGLESALQAEVLRVLNEACANAVRHGRATQIEIMLAAGGDRLELPVRGDGDDFDVSAPDEGGIGLRSMAERLARRAGEFAIASTPGAGTTVHATIPLPRGGR
jgi:signal transduction histidine kinase